MNAPDPASLLDATPPPANPALPDLNPVAQLARHAAGTEAAMLVEWTAPSPSVLAAAGLTTTQAQQALDVCLQAFEPPSREGCVANAAAHPRLAGHPLSVGSAPLCFVQALPLPIHPDQPAASLIVLDPAARTAAIEPSENLRVLADFAAGLLGFIRQHRQLLQQGEHTLSQSSNALLESESRLNLTEQTAGVGSWSLDPASGQMLHSDEFASILGLQPGESVASVEDMVLRYSPEWRNGIRQRLARCAQTGLAFDEEIQVQVAGTTPKWVRTVGRAVRGPNGQVLRIQGAMQDISAQKQAQQETTLLAMRLTTTLASITEAFVTLDRQCCFTYLNQESERLLQKTTSELLGQEVWHDFAPALAQRLRERLTRAVQSNRQVELEDHFPSLGKWLEVRAYPFAEGLAVYFRDVTERRRSQEQLMLLETSVARLNDIVAIAEASQDTREEPRIVFVNDAFELHTGYSRKEVMGQTPGMLLDLDPTNAKLKELATGLQHRRQARTELMVRRKNGAWFWVELEVVSVQSNAEEVSHWVAVGRDITQRKNAEDMIRHLAFYDALTDLPNRQLLLDRLQRALAESVRTRQFGALMFIDLDNFKILNDTLGHHMGDQLLQKVAQRLTQSVRKTDTVARLGGDEFVVMVDDLSTDREAAAYKAQVLAEKVLHTLREPFQLNGHQHFATPSIGVTSFCSDQSDVGELLKQADLAMYQAKTLGRNTLCFFDPTMQASVSNNAAVGADLREGLRERQFVVYYQPQVDRHGAIASVEALVRWQHPQRGLIMPGDLVLETACAQLAVWENDRATNDLSISVNVSVRQFRHPDFVDMVMEAIQLTRIRPHKLKLELTESLLADRMEITMEKMGLLKALGVTLSLDDFGVGYSSLSLLKRLPLDQLKIDKGFVADVLTDPSDAAISRAIIALAQSLGLQVVAEGVETIEQRDFLAAQGCGYFQGFLFAQPLCIDELNALLGAGHSLFGDLRS
ncbi:MAG: EAL domain-containing protein [Hydrogenophaga sp.]|nr:EAL domain-containing protein [Hydrogenophaga sp.]